MTEPISVYKNQEYGIEAHVANIESGFSVSLWDSECGESVGIILIYEHSDDAHQKAKELVK